MVAALERFMRDTAAPPAREPAPGRSPWGEAALLEATGHQAGERVAWRLADLRLPGPSGRSSR